MQRSKQGRRKERASGGGEGGEEHTSLLSPKIFYCGPGIQMLVGGREGAFRDRFPS
jgi:hypothetical protein